MNAVYDNVWFQIVKLVFQNRESTRLLKTSSNAARLCHYTEHSQKHGNGCLTFTKL